MAVVLGRVLHRSHVGRAGGRLAGVAENRARSSAKAIRFGRAFSQLIRIRTACLSRTRAQARWVCAGWAEFAVNRPHQARPEKASSLVLSRIGPRVVLFTGPPEDVAEAHE